MGYYPIFLEMKDRRCVVIGGGAVAERKVEGLVAVGANVTVISPAITDGLRESARAGRDPARGARIPSGRSGGIRPGFRGDG